MAKADPSAPPPLLVVAIDGPVASGKSVIGRRIADRLGWPLLDTGVMYRALTWLALERGVELRDDEALTKLAEATDIRIDPAPPGRLERARILIDGVDATPHLREPHVEASVSTVAAAPGVRRRMVELQRREALRGRMVMVGRDIGTVVVPDAAVKIYLFASAEVRAQRRAAEMRTRGREVGDAAVLQEIQRRDQLDAGRVTSPLRAADNAIELDTSALDLEGSVEAALRIVAAHLPAQAPR